MKKAPSNCTLADLKRLGILADVPVVGESALVNKLHVTDLQVIIEDGDIVEFVSMAAGVDKTTAGVCGGGLLGWGSVGERGTLQAA